MSNIKFSIIVAALNEQERIVDTIESVLSQSYQNFEIIVKDGCSTDNTVSNIPNDSRINVYTQKDTSVYDGMNQAIKYITGDFVMFLNCGDLLYDDSVLQKVADAFSKNALGFNSVIYGDYSKDNQVFKQHSPVDKLYLLEIGLCHQSIFMGKEVISNIKMFDTTLKICADYDSMIRAFLCGAKYFYIDSPVCIYAGGGISETGNAKNQVKLEGKTIRKKNFSLPYNVLYYFIKIKKKLFK